MPIELIVIGAGGHGKVVLDAWRMRAAPGDIASIVDEDRRKVGLEILGTRVEPMLAEPAWVGTAFHLAIGSNVIRARLHDRLLQAGGQATSIFHPAASVAGSFVIGNGSFVAALAVVAPAAKVGSGTIVNHGAVIDHDCTVGDFSHIGPNATLGGNVTIGIGVLVGAGATILPGVRIGDGAVIAAGSTIVRDVDPGEIVIFNQVRKGREQ